MITDHDTSHRANVTRREEEEEKKRILLIDNHQCSDCAILLHLNILQYDYKNYGDKINNMKHRSHRAIVYSI